MKKISRIQFISGVKDIEQLYLFEIVNSKVFFRGDIEHGGDLQIPRIEMMRFEINKKLPVSTASSECRSCYTGGITFIEYDDEEESAICALNDFLRLVNDVVYVSCGENELENIAENFTKAYIYTVLE